MSSSSRYTAARTGATPCARWQSPAGLLELFASARGLRCVEFVAMGEDGGEGWGGGAAQAIIAQAKRELTEYFAGERRDFSVPLDMDGTPFQRRIWECLRAIPYGHTTTYAALAAIAGRPAAIRAAGAANGANPIAIIVPCHRVIGSNGSLTGYAGGLETKRFLLELEVENASWG